MIKNCVTKACNTFETLMLGTKKTDNAFFPSTCLHPMLLAFYQCANHAGALMKPNEDN